MPKVVSYLECGCAILDGGAISKCPNHAWELEKQFGESQNTYPTQEELAAESNWEKDMEERAEEANQ